MVAIWASAVMSTAHSYWQAAMKAAWTDWAINKGEDWSPTEDQLRRTLDQVWVRGYQLITAAYQMERWRQACEGDSEDDAIEHLQALRNSLEHLDGAQFSAYSARKSKGKAWSIDQLPGHELFMGFHASFTDVAFGVVDLAEITERARLYLYLNEPPEQEPDWDDMS